MTASNEEKNAAVHKRCEIYKQNTKLSLMATQLWWTALCVALGKAKIMQYSTSHFTYKTKLQWEPHRTFFTDYGLNHSRELYLIHVGKVWDITTLWAMWAQVFPPRGLYLPLLDIEVCDWLVLGWLRRLVLFDNHEGGLLSHPPDALAIHVWAPLHEEHEKVVRPKAGNRTG